MRVMITGSSGYIGRKLDEALDAKGGDEIYTFDEPDMSKWESRFEEAFDERFDWVIHCGAIMDPNYTEPDIFQSNYECTKKIVDYCRYYDDKKNFIRLLFFSSCQALHPCNFYAWTKRCASDYIESNLYNYTIVRPFVVYGDEYGRFSKLSTVTKLIRGDLPVMFEPWIRDYIHVRDVVRAIVHIIDNNVKGVYDLGTGKGYTARDLFETWYGTFSDEIPPVAGPGSEHYPKGAPAELVAKELLPDFETRYNLFDYLESMKEY